MSQPSKPTLAEINSWGATWGQKGRFWLPYRFVDFADFDAWRTIDVVGDL